MLLGTQAPTFLSWRARTTARGVLLEWTVRGANGVARFTCIEIDGVIALAAMTPA